MCIKRDLNPNLICINQSILWQKKRNFSKHGPVLLLCGLSRLSKSKAQSMKPYLTISPTRMLHFSSIILFTKRFQCLYTMENPQLNFKKGKEQEKAMVPAMENFKFLEKEQKEKKFFGGETIGFVDLDLVGLVT